MDICIEHLPVRPLRSFVECIWYSDPTDNTGFEIIPDGCVDACFVLPEGKPTAMLFGTTTQTRPYKLESNAAYFGVRFRPGRAAAFVRERISELTDRQVEIPNFLGLTAEEVMGARSFSERKTRLESLLTRVLPDACKSAQSVIGHAVAQIDSRSGDIRVRDLAKDCNLSERQLERIFLDQVGVTPKLYSRIRRLRSVMNRLEDFAGGERPSMAEIAAMYGYADQSHLARELRLLSYSPTVL